MLEGEAEAAGEEKMNQGWKYAIDRADGYLLWINDGIDLFVMAAGEQGWLECLNLDGIYIGFIGSAKHCISLDGKRCYSPLYFACPG